MTGTHRCYSSCSTATASSHTIGEADYGAPYCCAVAKDNIVATQFLPEKSAAAGLRLYQNFVHWNP